MSINAFIVNLLGSRLHRVFDRSLMGLRIVGRRTGRRYEMPVQYAREPGTDFVVYPAHSSRKHWWRNFLTPTPLHVLVDGRWEAASARVVTASDHDYAANLGIYARRWAKMPSAGAPLIAISPT